MNDYEAIGENDDLVDLNTLEDVSTSKEKRNRGNNQMYRVISILFLILRNLIVISVNHLPSVRCVKLQIW